MNMSNSDTQFEGWIKSRAIRVARAGEGGNVTYANVAGWTKGSFGIWDARMQTTLGTLQLTTVTHLPTGYSLTVIPGLKFAAEAAEIAEKLADWGALKTEIPKDLQRRFVASLEAAGFKNYGLIADGQSVWTKDIVGEASETSEGSRN